jgi:hypothetical protein
VLFWSFLLSLSCCCCQLKDQHWGVLDYPHITVKTWMSATAPTILPSDGGSQLW